MRDGANKNELKLLVLLCCRKNFFSPITPGAEGMSPPAHAFQFHPTRRKHPATDRPPKRTSRWNRRLAPTLSTVTHKSASWAQPY